MGIKRSFSGIQNVDILGIKWALNLISGHKIAVTGTKTWIFGHEMGTHQETRAQNDF